ncbi:hypothetical protein FEM48_Zijuj02G0038500 [Ziziphus jujuba var. spinosa]|uniref:Glabrous enhancer-binding protein-like DBD domain-containing protein n=1 Tax=Ziziphus jujuba var. spinosa TaxID=714518 RepID=A0A978VTG6_ZIZJJ|nr:hypothetical protein FEM48_Zijuj02G0038500 [Ziziphus jujuba var. spinosa]
MSTPINLRSSSKRNKPSSNSPTTTTNTKQPSSSSRSPPEQFSGSQKIRPQRLFTEEDETHLLQIFYHITKSSPPSSAINSPNLDRIEKSLGLRFSHTQIIDKLRRLRLKYHKQARTKSLIKTHHDREVYKIARKIWGRKGSNSRGGKTEEEKEKEEEQRIGDVGLEEFPVLKHEAFGVLQGNVVWKKGLMGLEEKTLKGLNEKWMLLKMEEAEVMATRAELEKEVVELVVKAFLPSKSK